MPTGVDLGCGGDPGCGEGWHEGRYYPCYYYPCTLMTVDADIEEQWRMETDVVPDDDVVGAFGADASRADASLADASCDDASRADASHAGASRADASRADVGAGSWQHALRTAESRLPGCTEDLAGQDLLRSNDYQWPWRYDLSTVMM